MAAPSQRICYYELLEVSRTATDDELKTSFRKLALKFHPDKNPANVVESTKKFQQIQEAYECLSDPQERAWYDSHRSLILRGGVSGEDEGCGLSNLHRASPSGDSSSRGWESVYQVNLWSHFCSTCFDGYEDDEGGFYSVYRHVFDELKREEEEEDDDRREKGIKLRQQKEDRDKAREKGRGGERVEAMSASSQRKGKKHRNGSSVSCDTAEDAEGGDINSCIILHSSASIVDEKNPSVTSSEGTKKGGVNRNIGKGNEQRQKWTIPSFGDSRSSKEEVLRFYNFWENFSTTRTFSFADVYHPSIAQNRWQKRQIEKENQKFRKNERKEFSEVVRRLAAYVKRRDERVRIFRNQQADEKKQKILRETERKKWMEEETRRQREMRQECEREKWEEMRRLKMEVRRMRREESGGSDHLESDEECYGSDSASSDEKDSDGGSGDCNADKGSIHGDDIFENNDILHPDDSCDPNDGVRVRKKCFEQHQSAGQDRPQARKEEMVIHKRRTGEKDKKKQKNEVVYYCQICKKLFKSQNQFSSHEKSKKHQKNLEELEALLLVDTDCKGTDDDESNDVNRNDEDGVGEKDENDVGDDGSDGDSKEVIGDSDVDNFGPNEVTDDRKEDFAGDLLEEEDGEGDDDLHRWMSLKGRRVKYPLESSDDDIDGGKGTSCVDENPDMESDEDDDEDSEDDIKRLDNDGVRSCLSNEVIQKRRGKHISNDFVHGNGNNRKWKTKGSLVQCGEKQQKTDDQKQGKNDDDEDNGTSVGFERQARKNKSRRTKKDSDEKSDQFKCQVCLATFVTRNQLFKHINSSGHAALKDKVPPPNHSSSKQMSFYGKSAPSTVSTTKATSEKRKNKGG